MHPAGLVLAAGAGRRMGGPKAVLVDESGERWVDRAVRTLHEGGCAPVIVVLGAAVVDVPGATVAIATDWAEGMGASLRAGLAAVAQHAPRATAAVIALVDQPDLASEAVRRVGAAAATASDAGVAAMAVYAGHRGHPVALSRSIWSEVAALAQDDRGARDWLATHPERVIEVDCTGLGSDRDVDSR